MESDEEVESSNVLSVVLVGADELFDGSLEAGLDAASNGRIAVVGAAGTVDDALDLLEESEPDVVLVDLELPAPGAADLLRRLIDQGSSLRLIAIGREDDPGPAADALAMGVHAMVTRTAAPEHLMAPVLAVLQGWRVIPDCLVDELVRRGHRPGAEILTEIDDHTRQLWLLVAEGLDLPGIAEALHVSERTAKRLVADLRDRLGVGSRMEMAAMAGRVGLLDEAWADGAGPEHRGGRPTASQSA